jgi:signal transduction histidine kinase
MYFSRKKIIARELEIKNLKLEIQNKVIKAMIETQEGERTRIARDLHDSFGAKLSAVKNHLENLKGVDDNADNEDIYKVAIETCNTLYDNARRISHNMTPIDIEVIGLFNTIQQLCKDFNNDSSGTKIYLKSELVKSKINNLKREIQIHLYRILQELLVNASKHSQASKIFVEFDTNRNGQLQFSFSDNGKGSNKSFQEIQSGLGIQNIILRSGIIGGTFEFNTGEGKGFEFYLILPNNE